MFRNIQPGLNGTFEPQAASSRHQLHDLAAAATAGEQPVAGDSAYADQGFPFPSDPYIAQHDYAQQTESMGSSSPEVHDAHIEGLQPTPSSASTSPEADVDAEAEADAAAAAEMRPARRSKPKRNMLAITVAKRVFRELYSHGSLNLDSTVSKRLSSLVAKRNPEPRDRSHRPNLQRRGNVEAMLAQITGQVARNPCKSCRKGHGPWSECVVLDGNLCGSCANCWYNACGSRCTYHGKLISSRGPRDPSPLRDQQSLLEETGVFPLKKPLERE